MNATPDQPSTEPDSATENQWRAAIAAAEIPTLIGLLVQLTGTPQKWLSDRYRPQRMSGIGGAATGGLGEDEQDEIRTATYKAIRRWHAAGSPAVPPLDPALVVDVLRFILGEPIPDDYGPMAAAELHKLSRTSTGPIPDTPTRSGPADRTEFYAVVIGAGMSGIAASVSLAAAGIAHVVLERHDTVGGTWLENRYPGCGVDVPSHLYTYSFAPNDWTTYFSLRDEIHEYFERVAVEFGVRDRTRFGTTVNRAVWHEDRSVWTLDVSTPSGSQTIEANLLISAVGAFNTPRIPAVQGVGTFLGPEVHTAQWPSSGIDIHGKQVAVIGNGASAMQVVPAIAKQTAHTTVFQRSPHWVAPFEQFQTPIPEPVRFLLQEMPLYRAWYRLALGWAFNDRQHAALQKDPSWPHPERSLNPINDAHRRRLAKYIEEQLHDRPDLVPSLLPSYPPFGKRMLLDNGWYRTLCEPNVTLRTDLVAAVTPTGVQTAAGDEVEVDVIIWATGFDVAHFLGPIEVIGKSGVSIHDVWDGDDSRAYLGTVVPDFPNLFCLYGPNTQFGHGGSLIPVVERQLHYVVSLIDALRNARGTSIEVRKTVHDRYNEEVQAAHEAMVWTHPGMDTYYRNSKGRVVVNNPFRITEIWHRTKQVNPLDYVIKTSTKETTS
jgi:4-hydroxyacetophenone monooxygenase